MKYTVVEDTQDKLVLDVEAQEGVLVIPADALLDRMRLYGEWEDVEEAPETFVEGRGVDAVSVTISRVRRTVNETDRETAIQMIIEEHQHRLDANGSSVLPEYEARMSYLQSDPVKGQAVAATSAARKP